MTTAATPGLPPQRRRPLMGAVVALVCALLAVAAAPRADDLSEWEVKANMLLQFAGLVTWPDDCFEDEESPFVVGVLGEESFDGHLVESATKKKRINSRSIVIRRFDSLAELAEAPCHLLFVGELEDEQLALPEPGRVSDHGEERLAPLFRLAAERHLFTVSGLPGFARTGGVMRLFLVDGRHDFEINRNNAKRAELAISANLLKLATLVGDD